jgi:hypothetical protein
VIKSNNPQLAGGESIMIMITHFVHLFPTMSING